MNLFAVFNNDGYECSSLVGVFSTVADAIAATDRIDHLTNEFYRLFMHGCERMGSTTIKFIKVGEYELPANASYAEDNPDALAPSGGRE